MIIENLGLSAWITDSQKKQFQEYRVQRDEPETIQCWIPSMEGAAFHVRWKVDGNPHPGLDLCAYAYLDGVKATSCVHSNPSIVIGKTGLLYKKPTGPNTARTFEFGKRKLVENDTEMTLDESVMNQLNTIRLELVWGTIGRLKIRKAFKDVQDIGPIDEKSKRKGLIDAAKLGKTIYTGRSKSRAFQPDHTLKRTVFIFKYAPESKQPGQGIIPSINESHLRSYIDVDALDQDTKAELDTKVGIFSHSKAQDRVFWDSEGEIEVLKHLAPVPLHGFGLPKAENEEKDELKVEAKIEIEIED